jgi:hypothetical protein
MELAQDGVQWRALVLAVLNLRVLLPESYESAYNAVLPCVCMMYRSYRLLGKVCAARDLWGHSFTTMPQDAIVSLLLIQSRRY